MNIKNHVNCRQITKKKLQQGKIKRKTIHSFFTFIIIYYLFLILVFSIVMLGFLLCETVVTTSAMPLLPGSWYFFWLKTFMIQDVCYLSFMYDYWIQLNLGYQKNLSLAIWYQISYVFSSKGYMISFRLHPQAHLILFILYWRDFSCGGYQQVPLQPHNMHLFAILAIYSGPWVSFVLPQIKKRERIQRTTRDRNVRPKKLKCTWYLHHMMASYYFLSAPGGLRKKSGWAQNWDELAITKTFLNMCAVV